MTRRERLEARLERREEWADKAQARSEAAWEKSNQAVAGIPAGQPILKGHHSEGRHRRDMNRCHAAMDRSLAESKKAESHASKARGIELQLNRTIFSDDADAVEKLEAKIEKLEARCAQGKALNKAWKKFQKTGDRAPLYACGATDEKIEKLVEGQKRMPWLKKVYETSHDRAEIRRAKQRIEEIRERRARSEAAEKTESGVTVQTSPNGWTQVIFAERPDWEIRRDLKAAGYRWRQGCWQGTAPLPESVKELI